SSWPGLRLRKPAMNWSMLVQVVSIMLVDGFVG
ncbi:MAG: hypothetical protein ACI9JZ_003087, partial [Lentimonas sp.]